MQLKPYRKRCEPVSLCWENMYFLMLLTSDWNDKLFAWRLPEEGWRFVSCSPPVVFHPTSPHTLSAVCCAKCVRGCTVTRPGRLSGSSLAMSKRDSNILFFFPVVTLIKLTQFRLISSRRLLIQFDKQTPYGVIDIFCCGSTYDNAPVQPRPPCPRFVVPRWAFVVYLHYM